MKYIFRFIVHLIIFFLVVGLYTIFIYEDFHKSNFILTNNIVSIFIILSLVIEVRSLEFMQKKFFTAFGVNSCEIIFYRIKFFFRYYYLFWLLILPPLLLLFSQSIPTANKTMVIAGTITQNIFTVALFFIIYDLSIIFRFTKQVSILPSILAIIAIYFRQNQLFLYKYNPFGGIIIHLSSGNLIYVLYAILFLIVLLIINCLVLKKIPPS